MKPADAPELQWVGVDLHVHTPASADYCGSREPGEYVSIVRKANEFGAASAGERSRGGQRRYRNPIGCIAFTDHNSVEGFRSFRKLLEDTDSFAKQLRTRDPSNPLIAEIDKDLQILHSCRILMGVEIKADPGIHTLIIFAESVAPELVTAFMEEAYEVPSASFAGDPRPTAKWTLKDTLDRIYTQFGDNAFVIFPHVDSAGGVYEDLKDFPQARISALTHPVVRALQFTKEDSRERLLQLFSQPEYKRGAPVAFIQASDFHGADGTAVGQPRTELNVRDGKPTFRNLKEALRERRTKCSIDFVSAEYNRLVEGVVSARFTLRTGEHRFGEADQAKICDATCGMLNCEGGILEVERHCQSSEADEDIVRDVREQLSSILKARLSPQPESFPFRVFRLSPGKVRVLSKIEPSTRLHASGGRVYVHKTQGPATAEPHEIELAVSQKITRRFGERIEDELSEVAQSAKILSKFPEAIPLIIGAQDRLIEGLPKSIKFKRVPILDSKNNEIRDQISELEEKDSRQFPFGNPLGNATLLAKMQPPRFAEHYARFSATRFALPSDLLSKHSWPNIGVAKIAVHLSGGAVMAEPGFVVCKSPAVFLELEDEWKDQSAFLLAWLKSSFFLWYCVTPLGEDNPYLNLTLKTEKVPLPRVFGTQIVSEVGGTCRQLMQEETRFMEEINRLKKKGTLDTEYLDKLRRRHNASADALCLKIDEIIYEFLGLSIPQRRLISETLKEMGLTTFGYLQKITPEDDES